MKCALLLLLLVSAPAVAQDPNAGIAALNATQSFSVAVDPRVELLTAVARLAEFEEYRHQLCAWPYQAASDAWFAPHKNHAAVRALQRLRAKRGVSYDAIPSLAIHLTNPPELAERIPFESKPERLDARYPLDETRAFLKELRSFATDSKAAAFFASQKTTWDAINARLTARLAGSPSPEWLRTFFGITQAGSCSVIPGLLFGPLSCGVGVRFGANMPEELRPVLGCWEFDTQGLPVYGKSTEMLFAHELAHSWANAVVDTAAVQLDPIGQRLFELSETQMRRETYGTGRIVLYETLVRVAVIRCLFATVSLEAANEQARNDVSRGFTWVPALARAVSTYEADRTKWPQLADFVPEIVRVLQAEAERLAGLAANTPRLLSITPATGTNDVDPALDTMTLVFDRPMRAGGWSFVAAKEDLPEFIGKPSFDTERKVLMVKIRLEPGRSYRFQLNSERSLGFAAADGTPLAPVRVQFNVRAQ